MSGIHGGFVENDTADTCPVGRDGPRLEQGGEEEGGYPHDDNPDKDVRCKFELRRDEDLLVEENDGDLD